MAPPASLAGLWDLAITALAAVGIMVTQVVAIAVVSFIHQQEKRFDIYLPACKGLVTKDTRIGFESRIWSWQTHTLSEKASRALHQTRNAGGARHGRTA